jgi:hypothetical protein
VDASQHTKLAGRGASVVIIARRRFLDALELAGGEINVTRVLRGIISVLRYNRNELKIVSVTLYNNFR